ncbi:MAG: hypothetical protein WC003_06730 [Terrimicrobiaceae bacterium]
MKISVIEKIQVEGARSVEFMIRRPPQFDFDVLEIGEQIERRDLGGEFDGGIEEGRGAIRAVHRGSFVDIRAKERAGAIVEGKEPPPALAQVSEAVAEVGSQCDADSHG